MRRARPLLLACVCVIVPCIAIFIALVGIPTYERDNAGRLVSTVNFVWIPGEGWEKHGREIAYFASGEVNIREFRFGTQHGNETLFYPDGKPALERRYAYGERVGEWREYWRNGVLSESRVYETGTAEPVTWISYEETGRVRDGVYRIPLPAPPGLSAWCEQTYRGGVPHGTWRVCRSDGTVESELEFVNGKELKGRR